MTRHRIFLLSSILTILSACAPVSVGDKNNVVPLATNAVSPETLAKWRESQPDWYAPIEPFRVIGEGEHAVYYVGTAGLGMYFIPTEDGHIVLDGGMPNQGDYVAQAIHELGYDPADIKILLNSHAHLDHSGGLAELKAISGAKLVASEGDKSALEGGFYLGSEKEAWLNAPPVKVDRVIGDGETVTRGGVALTAHITPGHSRGCTSWTMTVPQAGKNYDVLFFCSATVAANRLVGPPQYDGIVADYRKTFAITKDWKPDVFLANHPGFFGLKDKREKLLAGDPLAFVGTADFPKLIAKLAAKFEVALQKQQLKNNAIMAE